MKITSFWVVTTATKNSEIADVLFEADIKRLRLQFLGGLCVDDIIGIYTDEAEARVEAENSLSSPRPRRYQVTDKHGRTHCVSVPDDE